ncbi:hypothetical protein MMC07_009652 [Pseudocyphellaria aurata]|nr:hypothetical protein [Pseudocyphellaria aurata]
MDAISAYTYSTAAWLSIQAVPLLLFPRLITAMLAPDEYRSTTSSSSSSPSHSLALPTLVLTTAFHACTAFYAYMQYTTTSQTAFALAVTGSGGLAAMGVWCMLFGTGGAGGKRQKNRVSGWPFKNQAVELSKLDRKGKRI